LAYDNPKEKQMTWSVMNLVIETIAGMFGGHMAAASVGESRISALGRSLVGAVGGAISGYFLQTASATVVTGSGSIIEPKLFDLIVVHSLTGAVVGGILMLVVGLLTHGTGGDQASKR
jgi:hypothetical protein